MRLEFCDMTLLLTLYGSELQPLPGPILTISGNFHSLRALGFLYCAASVVSHLVQHDMQDSHHTAPAVGQTHLDSRYSAPEILVSGVWHARGWCTGTATIVREIIAEHVHSKKPNVLASWLPTTTRYILRYVERGKQTALIARGGAFSTLCSTPT